MVEQHLINIMDREDDPRKTNPKEIAMDVFNFVRGTSAKNEDERRIRRNQGCRAKCEASICQSDLKGYIKENYGRDLVDSVMECFILTPRGNPKDIGFYIELKQGIEIGSFSKSK